MKKTLFTLLGILLSFGLFAQLELKPAVGFNIARFDSDPKFNGSDSLVASSRAGYQFGAHLLIGRNVFVEPGIFYTRLTQSFDPSDTAFATFNYGPSYLRIPVNLGFKFIGNPNSLIGIRIFVGPSLLLPLGVKENSYGIVKDDVKSPQFDFHVGAGLNIWLLFLDVSWGWGLTKQFDTDPIEARMQAFYASAGFRFKLKSDE